MGKISVKSGIKGVYCLLFSELTDKKVTIWRNDRVAEGARLESAYTPKGYRGFESRFLRKIFLKKREPKTTLKNISLINLKFKL